MHAYLHELQKSQAEADEQEPEALCPTCGGPMAVAADAPAPPSLTELLKTRGKTNVSNDQ